MVLYVLVEQLVADCGNRGALGALAVKQLELLESLVFKFRDLVVDPTESACVKALVLFKPGKQKIVNKRIRSGLEKNSDTIHFIRAVPKHQEQT